MEGQERTYAIMLERIDEGVYSRESDESPVIHVDDLAYRIGGQASLLDDQEVRSNDFMEIVYSLIDDSRNVNLKPEKFIVFDYKPAVDPLANFNLDRFMERSRNDIEKKCTDYLV